MKHLLFAPMLVLLLGCSTTSHSARQQRAITEQGPLTTLIDASATDFHQNTSKSIQFRGVRLGYQLTPQAEKQFLICGEFMQFNGGNKGAWSRFSTIKTEGYEQWLGALAAGLCDKASIVWEEQPEDLSDRLQDTFDALH